MQLVEKSFSLPDLLAEGVSIGELEIHLNETYSLEENLRIRGNIVGRFAPREAYQSLFPIGGGKMLKGPHVVCGHASPDVDTTIASFWSWVDAFAARVGEGPTLWYLPGGEMPRQAKALLESLFGKGISQILVSELPEKATVSLRDFCNFEEANLGEGHEVVSVVDHHRANLVTKRAATVLMADVQSCNVLLAEQMFRLNDQFGVHPKRAEAEQLCYLHAILDDTDLLSRVTARDVFCVAELLARLKEEKAMSFADLPHNARFAHLAARRLLEDPYLHALYNQIIQKREEEGRADLERCLEGLPSSVFTDTKEQKRVARVGQTKVFAKQLPWFVRHADQFRRAWLDRTTHAYERKPHLKLHLQMISTLLDDGLSTRPGDELWIWVPTTSAGFERLDRYLASFKGSPAARQHQQGITLYRPTPEMEEIFSRHFEIYDVDQKTALERPLAVLRFARGKLTSRKACITPYV